MRKLLTGSALAAIVLFGGAAAQASYLAGATFSLTLTGLPPAQFSATYVYPGLGNVGGPPGSGTVWDVAPGGVPGGTASASINSLAAPPLTHIQIIINSNAGTGAFAHTLGGAMLVTGVANVFGLNGFPSGGGPLLGVPIAVGAPGTVMAAGFGIFITAYANSWTTKTTAIHLTPNVAAANNLPSSFSVPTQGANNLVGGVGTVVLVSAVNVMTTISGQIPTFAVLTLQYVPEPGTLLLLGSGIAGLLALGRRKMR